VRPEIVPVVGARRPETIARIAAAERIVLDEGDKVLLDERFPLLGALRRPARPQARVPGEVVLMMGIPGAGKSRAAEAFVARGYERCNRDTSGGTLRGIARRLEERLASGARRVVLDNTYVSRADRNDVVRVAHAQGLAVRCLFFETPLADAQINAVTRILDRFGRLPEPEEMRSLARKDAAALGPNVLYRMARALEPPAADEGFDTIDVVRFERDAPDSALHVAAVFAIDSLGPAASRFEADDEAAGVVREVSPETPCLIYAWRPGLTRPSLEQAQAFAGALARAAGRRVDLATCVHPPGPPICWCRPPLPGMWLAFARRHGARATGSTLLGRSAADRAMAHALGMTFRSR
jgi:hypothetical protein